MERVARIYAPMSPDHILGFPNKMPKVDWLQNLPMFRNEEGNDAALHEEVIQSVHEKQNDLPTLLAVEE